METGFCKHEKKTLEMCLQQGLSALCNVAHHLPVLLDSLISLTVDFVKYLFLGGSSEQINCVIIA